MRVLMVITFYRPHWTGLTAHAARLAELLAARGHQVTVLTSRHDPSLAPDEIVGGVRVVRLNYAARFSRGVITPSFPLVALRLIRSSDLVQMQTPLPEALLVAGLCRVMGRPLVMTHHGDVVMPAGFLNQGLQRAAYWLLRGAGQLADRVTAYSWDYVDHSRLLSGFGDRVVCVYPPVQTPSPDPIGIARLRVAHGLSGRPLVGFAGRWVEEKGFDHLLEALPLVRERCPRAHLVYAGDPHVVYEDFFERCTPLLERERANLTMLGLLREPQELADFYGMCDLVAVPSRSDNMPLVTIEALLCGTPVVATDIPGLRVVVRETGYGRLAAPHSPTALAEAILDVLVNLQKYRPDPAEVRRTFNAEQSIDQYESIMQEILARRRESRAPDLPPDPQLAPQAPARSTVLRLGERERTWEALGAEDHVLLDDLLRNEADMAFRRRARVLLDYLEPRDDARLLDLGCGMGFYLLALARMRRIELVGVDLDVHRLGQARAAAAPAHLLRADIQRLPFPDDSFDGVLMTEVLEHLAADRAGLAEAFRVLRPGGVLAISVPHADYPFWWDPINRVWTRLGGRPFRGEQPAGIWSLHERLYRPAELVERVSEAGFLIERVEEATHYGFPFIHFAVYGIGKPLVERRLLPDGLRRSVDRLAGEEGRRDSPSLLSHGVALFRAVDRLNDHPGLARKRTFVNVLLKARKPSRDC